MKSKKVAKIITSVGIPLAGVTTGLNAKKHGVDMITIEGGVEVSANGIDIGLVPWGNLIWVGYEQEVKSEAKNPTKSLP